MLNRKKLLYYFRYDKNLGMLLWKNPHKNHSYLIGKRAGTTTKGTKKKPMKLNYRMTFFERKFCFEHKIIYFLEFGFVPKLVDHINGDTLDNRIENLRATTNRQNCQNRKIHRNGRLVGASWDTQRKKWFSCIQINGKTKGLGRYATEQQAHEKYLAALSEL